MISRHYAPLSGAVQKGLAYADAKKQGAVLGWGNFITVAINFIIIAIVLFFVVRSLNKLKLRSEAAAEPPADVKILTEIRDLLAARSQSPGGGDARATGGREA